MKGISIKAAAIAVVGIIFFLLIAVWGPAACQRIRSLTAQGKVDEAQSGAFHNSAGDAVNTTGNVASNAAASEGLTRSNEKEIRNAQGASDRVNPDVGRAGLNSLCRRAAYRNDPACRVQQPHP